MFCLSNRFAAAAKLGLGLLLLSAAICRAQDTEVSESKLKALYIFNFPKFIEWPTESLPDDKSPFIIGVIGENPIANDLESVVQGKTVNRHPIEIRKGIRSAADATNCHILFISAKEKDRVPELIKQLNNASVLTVGENERFVEDGGMIKLFMEANKVRFQIKDETAKKAKIKISSKLLILANRPSG